MNDKRVKALQKMVSVFDEIIAERAKRKTAEPEKEEKGEEETEEKESESEEK